MGTRLGVLLWSQAATWGELEDGARRVEALGYDHLWAWDHLYAIFGDPYQPIFEGYTTLAAWAKVTTRASRTRATPSRSPCASRRRPSLSTRRCGSSAALSLATT